MLVPAVQKYLLLSSVIRYSAAIHGESHVPSTTSFSIPFPVTQKVLDE